MALPRSRDYTASDGVTTFPAATDEALQDGDVRDFGHLAGDLWRFEDDFNGRAIDTGKWSVTDPGPIASFVGEANSMGSVLASSAANGIDIKSQPFDLGTRDFYYRSRWKLTSVGGALSSVKNGFVGGAAGRSCFVYFNSGDTYWTVSLAGVNHVTAIAPALGSWSVLEIERAAGVFTFTIDDVIAYTETISIDMSDDYITWATGIAGGGTTSSSIDYVKAYSERED